MREQRRCRIQAATRELDPGRGSERVSEVPDVDDPSHAGSLRGASCEASRWYKAIMLGATEMVERERKFEAPDIVEIPDVPGISVVDDSDVRLTATYWDTVHRRLLRWGHTLRHRRASDGSEGRW